MHNLWISLTISLYLLLSGCGDGETLQPVHHTDLAAIDAKVLEEFKAIGSHHVLLIGDSLTERNHLTTLCDLPVINAGYPGATWEQIAARPIWAEIESKYAVVQAGTNNALRGPVLSEQDIETFLDSIRRYHLLVVIIPPLFPGPYWSPAAEHRLLQIQALQAELPYHLLDERAELNHAGYYVDGVHWNAAAYQIHNANLAKTVCIQPEDNHATP